MPSLTLKVAAFTIVGYQANLAAMDYLPAVILVPRHPQPAAWADIPLVFVKISVFV